MAKILSDEETADLFKGRGSGGSKWAMLEDGKAWLFTTEEIGGNLQNYRSACNVTALRRGLKQRTRSVDGGLVIQWYKPEGKTNGAN